MREALERLVKAAKEVDGLITGGFLMQAGEKELAPFCELGLAREAAESALAASKSDDDRLVNQVANLITFTRHLRIGETADGAVFVQVIELHPEERMVAERIVATGEGGLWDCLQAVARVIGKEAGND